MSKHTVTLSDPLSEMLEAQIKNGRFKDLSAAMQEAAWSYFYGQPSPFAEYGVTPREVESTARRDLAAIRSARKSGRLSAWKPGK